MARTPSNMMPLGTKAPHFKLLDTASGHRLEYTDIRGRSGTLVMFICNHCPFVVHVLDELLSIGHDYKEKGIGIVAISSNDIENYPDDSPENMHELAGRMDFPFPYLFDETQDVARAYDAACTPDFFLFNAENECVYRGQLDGSRPGNDIPVTGEDLRNALELLLQHKSVEEADQKPSIGCGIKWKA